MEDKRWVGRRKKRGKEGGRKDGWRSLWLRGYKRHITVQVNDQSLVSKRVKDHKPLKEGWDLEIQIQGTGFYSEGRQESI